MAGSVLTGHEVADIPMLALDWFVTLFEDMSDLAHRKDHDVRWQWIILQWWQLLAIPLNTVDDALHLNLLWFIVDQLLHVRSLRLEVKLTLHRPMTPLLFSLPMH